MKIDHIKRKHLEEPLPITIFDPNQPIHSITSDSNTQFLQFQIFTYFLSHCTLTNEQILDNKSQLITLCKDEYHDNSNQLKILQEFEHTYSSANALWWFTLDSFLYQLLTKSLIVMDIQFMCALRFFIDDLLRQLKQNQTVKNQRFYRCYLMTDEELEIFKRSIGKYLSINRFFSTYINRQHALDFLPDDPTIYHRVLLKFDYKSRLDSIRPFANLTFLGQTNEEILFSFGSLFRLDNVQYQQKDHLIVIHLTLYSQDHRHFHPVFDYIQQQFGENECNLLSLGNALRRIGQFDQAEKCYTHVLKDSHSNAECIARSYHHLGRMAATKGEYETSLEYLNHSLDLKIKLFKSTDPRLAQSYNSIGIVYQKQGEQEKALEVFNKALIIWKKIYGKSHPTVAGCYNNMGAAYKRAKNYLQALECFEKALAIRQGNSSTDPHDLAGSHNNIGAVYERLGHHDLSIEHYNLSLKIKSKSLPPQHPSIASTLENLGYVYEHRGAYIQALSYLEKAAIIYRQSLPANHHDVQQIEQSLERVSLKL